MNWRISLCMMGSFRFGVAGMHQWFFLVERSVAEWLVGWVDFVDFHT